jgi:hypothetical protein
MPQRLSDLKQFVPGEPTAVGIQDGGFPSGETNRPFIHQVVEGGGAGTAGPL